jgi:2-iminobutanoate/2-iminopropanoate deaminase
MHEIIHLLMHEYHGIDSSSHSHHHTGNMFMSHHREIVATTLAPKAIGPYSQANIAGNFVFVSGQLGLDPESGAFVEGGVAAQTDRALKNLTAIILEAGCSLDDVVACTVYMKDMNDFVAMNEVYGRYFALNPPSRAAIEVARLPKDGLVEISCIAAKK